jgi:hypothetical protein
MKISGDSCCHVTKCVHCDEATLPDGLVDRGHFNEMPSPWREASVSEYVRQRGCYSPAYFESRNVLQQTADGVTIGNITIEWYHNVGFAIRMPNKWHYDRSEVGKIVYDEPIRYFRIGCEHDYTELSQAECRARGIQHMGHCWHVTECGKCGHIESYDSSD